MSEEDRRVAYEEVTLLSPVDGHLCSKICRYQSRSGAGF